MQENSTLKCTFKLKFNLPVCSILQVSNHCSIYKSQKNPHPQKSIHGIVTCRYKYDITNVSILEAHKSRSMQNVPKLFMHPHRWLL